MNKKILIISIILLLLIFLYILYLFSLRKKYINEAYELNKKLKTHNEQEENNKQEIKNNDYLYLTEEDFDKLDIPKRWKYRSQCLNKLSQKSKDLVLGRYQEELNSPSLAKKFAMSATAVRLALMRIRKQLKLCVEEHA